MNEEKRDEDAPKKKKVVQLHVCSIIRKNEGGVSFGIYHKLPGNVKLMLKRGFAKPEDAFNYLREHRAELEEQTAAMKRKPNVEIEVTSERDGKDYRGGRNIDNAEFMETFGISGVTYGNWVNQSARQAKLNATYDALMDLAFVLGIPARAISLNGSLGVQFGASGKGKAKAHYRPNDVSINLTRDKGDGSLAHEWWHALDNYFMRQHADNPLMMTSDAQKEVVPQVMNAEAAESFLALMRALRSGTYYTRAKLYDDTTNGKGYWDSIVEMGARAFQCYVAEKVREGGLNDYLSSYISKEEFARMDAAFEKGMNESRYPYPTAEEMKDLRPMFDKFFSSLTHKEGEGGNLVTFSNEVDEEDDEISMQPGESEANFAERVSIMNRAKSNGTWLKAPNGKQSNLNPQQWTMVRTKAFKNWFGDWASVTDFRYAYRKILSMNPVAYMTGAEFKRDTTPDILAEYWEKVCGGMVTHPLIGSIELNRRSAKDNIKHGVYRMKMAAFTKVHEVLRTGIIFDKHINHKGRGYDTYCLAAPVMIGSREYICQAIVKQYPTFNRFYLHEVELKEKLPAEARTGLYTGLTSGEAKGLLSQKAQEVNATWENCSKILDENGEPLVVYHITDGDFVEFDLTRARQNMDIPAFFFSSGMEDWADMGSRVMACL